MTTKLLSTSGRAARSTAGVCLGFAVIGGAIWMVQATRSGTAMAFVQVPSDKPRTTAEQIIQSFATATQAARDLSAARGYVITFGKYRGRSVGEVPPGYLRWALKTCDNMPHNLRRAMQIMLNH